MCNCPENDNKQIQIIKIIKFIKLIFFFCILRWNVTWTCFSPSYSFCSALFCFFPGVFSFLLNVSFSSVCFLFCNLKGKLLSKSPAEGCSGHTGLSFSNGNLRPGGCLLWILGDLCAVSDSDQRDSTVMFLCMFVVAGSGAVSKKKDTVTSQYHPRAKNPPKSAPAAALHWTPSTGHSSRTGPQNNLKVRLTGVRPQLTRFLNRMCVAELCWRVWFL